MNNVVILKLRQSMRDEDTEKMYAKIHARVPAGTHFLILPPELEFIRLFETNGEPTLGLKTDEPGAPYMPAVLK